MFHFKKTTLVNSLISIVISVFAVALIVYASWSEPTTAPPGGNVPAPINVGSESQVKSGALGVGGVFRAFSDLIVDGNVGIGTESPNSSKGSSGYLDTKDVYLRDVGKWASESGGGGCKLTGPITLIGQMAYGNVQTCPSGYVVVGYNASQVGDHTAGLYLQCQELRCD